MAAAVVNLCFQMVFPPVLRYTLTPAHQHTCCASSSRNPRAAPGGMSPAADACCSSVYIRLSLSVASVPPLSFPVTDMALSAPLSTCREAVQHTHTHTQAQARTHTHTQRGCILPCTVAGRITVREITVNICSMTMMRLAKRRLIYSVTSFYGCLSYINSLPLSIPPCPSLTHSLPPPLVLCLTVFSLPPSVYPLLVLLTLCRVLSLILLFFHTLLPSRSSLCVRVKHFPLLCCCISACLQQT